METKWIFLDLQIGLYYGGISSFFFNIFLHGYLKKSAHCSNFGGKFYFQSLNLLFNILL